MEGVTQAALIEISRDENRSSHWAELREDLCKCFAASVTAGSG